MTAVTCIPEDSRLALLMHGSLGQYSGKMGHGILRYSNCEVVAVIDRDAFGRTIAGVTGITTAKAPIVVSVQDALAFSPDVLVIAVSPPGGQLLAGWEDDLVAALTNGLSVVHGLHATLSDDPRFSKMLHSRGQFILDIRREPPGLMPGSGRALEVSAKRVLMVGTDMNNGKMTTALELNRAARLQGQRSAFLATGQTGIAIAGRGVPVDGIRVDFVTGAVEQAVITCARDVNIIFIEGQGSLIHPASSATLALMRGAMPTHMILVHRAYQTCVKRAPWVKIPPLPQVIQLYEAVGSAAGALPNVKIVAISLNTADLSEAEAMFAIREVGQQTGLPVSDPVRFGCDNLLHALED